MQSFPLCAILSPAGRIVCPACGRATRHEVRPDTVAIRLPIWCHRCKRRYLAEIHGGNVRLSASDPEAQDSSTHVSSLA